MELLSVIKGCWFISSGFTTVRQPLCVVYVDAADLGAAGLPPSVIETDPVCQVSRTDRPGYRLTYIPCLDELLRSGPPPPQHRTG